MNGRQSASHFPKTFLLGLGAQKAGTTWVHAFLSRDARVDFGPVKEYHVWDAVTLPEMSHFDHRSRSRFRAWAEGSSRSLLGLGPNNNSVRGQLQADPDNYFRFFTDLLAKPGTDITGDITPAYSGLPATVLAQVRDGFSARGIGTRAIFIMRDPAERAISAATMNRRKNDPNEDVPLRGGLDAAVLSYAHSPAARVRDDYRATVSAIRAVFPEEDTFFGFYETLFSAHEVQRLADFAGVRADLAFTGSRINSHAKTESVSEATRARLREIYKDTYRFCADAFPETRALWHQAATVRE